MSPNSSPAGRAGVLAVAALVAVVALGTALWWFGETAEARRIGEALEPYAGATLPAREAPVDSVLATVGSRIFRRRCSACHAITGESRVGPDLAGVTRRRDFGWIRSMVLRPDSMTAHDPVARALKEEYQVQMLTPRTLDDTHVVALLEFLRRVDAGA
jgi:mono/diheme cytochrome c family protein